MIHIIGGMPSRSNSASYTRFVLPFAYRLEQITDCRVPTFSTEWRADSQDDKSEELARRRYLTDETEEVLFERAKWFKLDQPVIHFSMKNADREVPITLLTPRLVLFECCSGSRACGGELLSGFLILEASFTEGETALDDLLLFNELFRYCICPYEGHSSDSGDYTKVLGKAPVGLGTSTIAESKEDNRYFERWDEYLKLPVKLGDNFYSLMPETWHDDARRKATGSYITEPDRQKTGWMVYADNRAFVWTCAVLAGDGSALKDRNSLPCCASSGSLPWQWVRLLNVDGPGWGETSKFENAWADERTYKRWIDAGSYYGFCYHSGAMLGTPRKNQNTSHIFGSMYFDQALILLYLRVTLFRFSRALSRISATAMAGDDAAERKWVEDFRELRWQFMLFTNMYQFPLLSNQQQGLELYTLARKRMEIDDLFEEIQHEVQSSYEFLASRADQEETAQSTRLTVVATVGLVFGLTFSFLGMAPEVLNDWAVLVVATFPIFSPSSGTTSCVQNEWCTLGVATVVFIVLTMVIIYVSTSLSNFFGKLARNGERLKNICFGKLARNGERLKNIFKGRDE